MCVHIYRESITRSNLQHERRKTYCYRRIDMAME